MIECYYLMALFGNGQAYLDAEQALTLQGQAAVPFLQERLKNASPFDKAVVEVVLERISGNKTFQTVIDFLDETERKTAPTAMGAPSPEWVAGKLFQDFGSRAALLLGVYLNKLGPVWPSWKIMGVILYLGELTSAASADSLLKFLTTTPSEHYGKFALASLVAVGDRGVLSKLGAELKSRALVQVRLQGAADQIEEKLRKQASP